MKYLLLCTFSCHEIDDDELFMNNWKVGEFETLEKCYEESFKDLEQVGKDSLEPLYDEEDEEVYLEQVRTYVNGYIKNHVTETDLKLLEPTLILSNDYWTDYRREMLNYIIIKLED